MANISNKILAPTPTPMPTASLPDALVAA